MKSPPLSLSLALSLSFCLPLCLSLSFSLSLLSLSLSLSLSLYKLLEFYDDLSAVELIAAWSDLNITYLKE